MSNTILKIDEWLVACGIDKAYKKEVRDTYKCASVSELKAQDQKTHTEVYKEIGEWLDTKISTILEINTSKNSDIITAIVMCISNLKQGKPPEGDI